MVDWCMEWTRTKGEWNGSPNLNSMHQEWESARTGDQQWNQRFSAMLFEQLEFNFACYSNRYNMMKHGNYMMQVNEACKQKQAYAI
jgi:hypothetical protein